MIANFIAVVILTLGTTSAHAARIHNFDIDGTLVHDSGLTEDNRHPAWWSYWVLVRLSHMNNGWAMATYQELDAAGKLPPYVLVTRHEMDHLLRDKLATREERPGNAVEVKLLRDPIDEAGAGDFLNAVRPEKIYPGFYRINPDITYRHHDDSSSLSNNLLVTYQAAKARTLAHPKTYEWQGPAFPYLKKALARQGKNERVFLLTDRNASQGSVDSWIKAMHEDGYLPERVKIEDGNSYGVKVISTTSVSGRNFGSLNEFDSRKAGAIAEQIPSIARSPLDKHLTLSPDLNEAIAGKKRLMHEFIIYENRPEYIRQLVREMKILAVRYPEIKLVLFHAGSMEQVLGADFNQVGQGEKWSRWLVFTPSAKGWRQPLASELAEFESCEQGLLK